MPENHPALLRCPACGGAQWYRRKAMPEAASCVPCSAIEIVEYDVAAEPGADTVARVVAEFGAVAGANLAQSAAYTIH